MGKISYTTAGSIYDIYLKRLNGVKDKDGKILPAVSLREAFGIYYQERKMDASRLDSELVDFLTKVEEAISEGKKLGELSDYLYQRELEEANKNIKPDVTTIEKLDKDGNTIAGVSITRPSFDPSGKSDVSSKIGSATNFEFEDESTRYLNPEREEGYANSMIAARGADKNTSGIGTRDTFETPEPLIIGDTVDTLNDGVDKKNVPSFGETNAPASMDDPNAKRDFVFGDGDNNQSKEQGPDSEDNGLKF